MKLNDKVYDVLKWIVQLVLPGLGTLYFVLSGIWGLPYAEQVLGTITAITTFLGATLKISSGSYEGDGTLMIDQSDASTDIYRLDLNDDPSELKDKNLVVLKVDPDAKLSTQEA